MGGGGWIPQFNGALIAATTVLITNLTYNTVSHGVETRISALLFVCHSIDRMSGAADDRKAQ